MIPADSMPIVSTHRTGEERQQLDDVEIGHQGVGEFYERSGEKGFAYGHQPLII